mmetsp:Transcript_12649/g.27484  ORF Transcript_12649/g.27484 Transcript_12649/m.27484 type:complete len:267 (-) Transcript_12649:849-1649(-)
MTTSARSTVCGLLLLLCFFIAPSGWAFTMPRGQRLIRPNVDPPHALPPDVAGDAESARGYFYFWFFGGSGGIGIAVRQFPQQLDNFKRLFTLANEGTSTGGETIGLSPLCLYPRDIALGDLQKILDKKLVRDVEKMVKVGPKPNYLSEKGYLCYPSFADACKDCNPLTVRAVFDAMSTGDNVSPDVAQAALDSFASDIGEFKNALLRTKLSGFSSIVFLLFLLGPIVGATCLDALSAGWFPEWPGNENLPWSLLSPSVVNLPDYWT